VASLSRALYGLGLDEIRELLMTEKQLDSYNASPAATTTTRDKGSQGQYQSSTSTSGREIVVQVSLPLPFSDHIAASRFTDLPQQSRWSPWLTSVSYLDDDRGETLWTLNVRGIKFSWRAQSSILKDPIRGITWQSINGLKNAGVVEFHPTSKDSCVMQVRMTIITPRLLSALFEGSSAFIEDFLRNKLLKWSLEMFRDVVKADLALERGDLELGDALLGAVEGKANAIEATLGTTKFSRENTN